MGPKIKNLIAALSEGLLGKVVFNSKINISDIYTEYLLYEPIIQIANKNWNVKTEVEIGVKKGRGEKKRIDFVITSKTDNRKIVAIEVKYLKNTKSKLNCSNDIKKLSEFLQNNKDNNTFAFLMIIWKEHVNRKSHKKKIEDLLLKKYYGCSFVTNLKQSYNVDVLRVKPSTKS